MTKRREKLNYIDCKVDNLVGYSTEYWCGALEADDYRKYMRKAIKECDYPTLLWLAKQMMRLGHE